MKKIACIGAGFSGAVIARVLADAGYCVDVFDSRSHIAGNCHTYRDEETDVMIHAYGPHIFHTNNKKIWDYVNKFDEFKPFVNRVKARTGGAIYSMPINLHTINQFFSKTFSPEEARNYIASKTVGANKEARTFEEQAMAFVGKDIYEAFFKSYTLKQWGVTPDKLPASILKRLPMRFNYNDNYYASKYQGIPLNGYTYIVNTILDHDNINVILNKKVDRNELSGYHHIFNSGSIDAWFNFQLGRLGYRTLKFESETHEGDYQGNAVINYCDMEKPWTRISEHKHFAPWEEHKKTVIYKEYSSSCEEDDIPYYPIRLVDDKKLLAEYISLANQEKGITFVGRLGTYRYLDMHITIEEALNVAEKFLQIDKLSGRMPVFNVDVLS